MACWHYYVCNTLDATAAHDTVSRGESGAAAWVWIPWLLATAGATVVGHHHNTHFTRDRPATRAGLAPLQGQATV